MMSDESTPNNRDEPYVKHVLFVLFFLCRRLIFDLWLPEAEINDTIKSTSPISLSPFVFRSVTSGIGHNLKLI